MSGGRALLAPLLALVGLLAIGSGLTAPSVAAEATAPAAIPGLAVTSDTATVNFPGNITFGLTVSARIAIARAELFFHPVADPTLNLISAPITPAPAQTITFPLDMQVHYVPPGVDLTYSWRLTDTAGNMSQTPAQTLLWRDTRFPWQPVQTDQVTVYSSSGDTAFAGSMLKTAQAAMDRMQTMFAVTRSQPIRIWVYNSSADFSGALQPNSEPWIAGYSYPGLYLIEAVIPDGSTEELQRIIPHEISHQVLFQATRNPFNLPPRWLDEGLATYIQPVGTEGLPSLLQQAEASNSLMSLRSLDADFPYDSSYQLAYAESWSVVGYIIDHYGADGMARLIATYRDGVSPDESIQRAFGINLDELDRQWRASLSATIGTATVLAVAGAVTAPPPPGPSVRGLDLPAHLASGDLVIGGALVAMIVAGGAGRLRARRATRLARGRRPELRLLHGGASEPRPDTSHADLPPAG